MSEDRNQKIKPSSRVQAEGKTINQESNKSSDEVEKLKQEVKRLTKQNEDYLNGWKRAKADYINFKKESEQRQMEIVQFANADLVLQLFPLVDQFKKAFAHLPKDLEKNDWVKGMKHIQDNLNNFLKERGIEQIKTVGEKFDPEWHEAVERVKSKEKEEIVVEEVCVGFKMHDKVIQPAKVKVAE